MRQRVLAAVDELGYQPSRVARSLRGQRAKIIGVIVSDIQNPFFPALVRAVEDRAHQHGYVIFLCNTDEDIEKERLYIGLMRAEKVAGVVISATQETCDACKMLIEAGIPVVSVDRRLPQLDVDTVVADNVNAARALVLHLIEDGHRRIGAILADPANTTGRERYEGYAQALQRHNLPLEPALLRTGKPDTANGYRFAGELLDLPSPPTALFTGNNLLTVGALRLIQERGYRIPGNISLAAFDDLDWMALVQPGITVAAQPTYGLGQTAADLLFRRIEGDRSPPHEAVLSTKILIRQSCGAHGHAPDAADRG